MDVLGACNFFVEESILIKLHAGNPHKSIAIALSAPPQPHETSCPSPFAILFEPTTLLGTSIRVGGPFVQL